MLPLRVALAQIDTTVGAFEANAAAVREATARARAAGAQLVVFPELTLTGYPPRDLLELRRFVDRSEATLAALAAPADWSKGIAVAVGFAERHGGIGAGVYNAAAVLQDGRVDRIRKRLLPTYDVFDERRTTDPGPPSAPVAIAGRRVGFTICEDVWNDEAFWRTRRYPEDPVTELVREGIDLLVNLSASPFAQGKSQLREEMLAALCRRHRVPLAYANLVGGNDQLVFDGRSVALGADGGVSARGPAFEDALVLAWQERPLPPLPAAGSDAELDEIERALALGVRDYARKTGFSGALLGLSGGVDSALTACLAVRALGPDAVRGVALPSRFTSSMSDEDAERLARALGIRFDVVPIEPVFERYLTSLTPVIGPPAGVTAENLQSRVRGALLMALSNQSGALLLATGNKSELSVGYTTLYGDLSGGLAPIGDVTKTAVYRLARHQNRERDFIPERTLTRPPTAELRQGQTDQDTLPPYELLDEVVRLSTEERLSADEIVARGLPEGPVRQILSLLVRSEYKRRQAPPILRVTSRAFGDGWRFPIAHRFER